MQNFLPKPGTAMHGHPPCPPRSCCGPSPWPGSCSRPRCTCRPRRTSPTTCARCSTRASTTGAGCRRSPSTTSTPSGPGPPCDLLRAATEAAGLTLAARLTVYPSTPPTPSGGSIRPCASPCSTTPTPRSSDARTLVLGGHRAHRRGSCATASTPLSTAPAAAARRRRRPATGPAGAVAEVLAGVGLGQEVDEDEIVTLFSARGPEVRRRGRGGRPVCGATRWATSSPGSPTATSTTPTSAPSSASSAPSPRGPCRSTCGAPPTCWSSSDITERVVEAEAAGATEVCLQGGIHPKFDGDYYLDVIRAVRQASDAHPHPRLHRPGGDRRGAPPGREPRRLPAAPQGGRSGHPAGHRGGDPRRRGPGRAVSRQDRHRPVARGTPRRPQHRTAVERHHHVRVHRAAPVVGPPSGADPRPATPDGRLHRVRALALRAHGVSHLSPAPGPTRPDVPRDAAHARRGAHRLSRAGSRTSRPAG